MRVRRSHRIFLAAVAGLAAVLPPVPAGAAGTGQLTLSQSIQSNFATRVGTSRDFPNAVTVRNTGTGPLAFGPWRMEGSTSSSGAADPYAPREFTWTTDCPQVLAAGASCSIRMRFNAMQYGAGKAFGTLVLPHDGDGPAGRLEVWAPGTAGYYVANASGQVRGYGDADSSALIGGVLRWDLGLPLNQPIIGGARSASGDGVYLVALDGGIFTLGDAPFFGSTGDLVLNQPVLGMAATATGAGYWLVARDGGIFTFGDAQFHGSTGSMKLNQPVVGMTPTPSGRGYWLVAADGGIFTFGDAQFHGSTGGIRLNQPIVAMAATPSGRGYWLLARDGGIFTFGDAPFHGAEPSASEPDPSGPVGYWVGVAPTPNGKGYWLLRSRHPVVQAFGDAQLGGMLIGASPWAAIVPTARPVDLS